MLEKVRRKVSKVRRGRREGKLKQIEKERRLSYIRTRKAEELGKQQKMLTTQSTKEKRALEEEWEDRRTHKGEVAAARKARAAKYTKPAVTAAKTLGTGLGILGRGLHKGTDAFLRQQQRATLRQKRGTSQRQPRTAIVSEHRGKTSGSGGYDKDDPLGLRL